MGLGEGLGAGPGVEWDDAAEGLQPPTKTHAKRLGTRGWARRRLVRPVAALGCYTARPVRNVLAGKACMLASPAWWQGAPGLRA